MGGMRAKRTGRPALRFLKRGVGMRRVAAVDIGTNSTRLLIADASGAGFVDIARLETVTGLGRGVDRSGRLQPESIERTSRALASYRRRIRETGVERARAIATSAARDAINRKEFLEAAHRALGFRPEVIRGDEEAALVFAGATMHAPEPGAAVVIDIGGGSTEIVTDRGGVSIDIGSVRLSERRLPEHPAAPHDLAVARRETFRAIGAPDGPRRSRGVGAAGTWTSLAAIHLGLDVYDPQKVEGTTLHLGDVESMVTWLGALTLEEKRAIPSLDPKRAPVILGGAIVAETVLKALGLEAITVTVHDSLDGVCGSLLDQPGP